MSAPESKAPSPVRRGDLVITLLLLAIFVGAFVTSFGWPFRAAFFPKLLSGAGILLALLKLAGLGMAHRRAGDPDAPVATAELVVGDTKIINEEEEEDRSLEYVFATAGGAAWAAALGWIVGFFVMLYVFGVFVAVPVFALAYLRIAGGVGWVGAILYAGITAGILYVAFAQLLNVPMPPGIF